MSGTYVQDNASTLTTSILEQTMGSTTFGNVTPAIMIGLAMPQNIKINRAGLGRVSVMVAPS